MKLKEFIIGLDIIKTYYDDQCGYHLGAEHDQFYLYATDRPITPLHLEVLKELGWFQPEQDDNGYDILNGWSAHV